MNNDTKRRVALACVALSSYAACGDTSPPPEAQHTPRPDTPKLDYAQPASQERPEDYVVRVATTRPPRAARSARTPRQAGELPPASVIACESGGDYRAENPTSSASGRYQITDGSWDGHGGYSHAADAPPAVQDEKARQMWAGGAGWRHWRSCL